MNGARAKRRWRKWWRYADHIIKIAGDSASCPPGLERAYKEGAVRHNFGEYRQCKPRYYGKCKGDQCPI